MLLLTVYFAQQRVFEVQTNGGGCSVRYLFGVNHCLRYYYCKKHDYIKHSCITIFASEHCWQNL